MQKASGLYTVKYIAGHRIGTSGQLEYEVVWEEEGPNTFEPKESFKDSRLVAQYWEKVDAAERRVVKEVDIGPLLFKLRSNGAQTVMTAKTMII